GGGDAGFGQLDQFGLGGADRVDHDVEHRGLAVAGWEGDQHEQVGGFDPAGPDLDHGAAAGGGGQGGQGDASGEVGWGLGELGDGGDGVGDPGGQGVDREGRQLPVCPGQGDR